MSFQNIVGNDRVKEFLEKSLKENHISHSYLFIGIEGIGKTLFAKELARKILCIDKEETENCLSCIKFKSGNHTDFEQIEPEGGTIKIEQIRNMQESISTKPITSKKKVYLIIDSHLMTKEAQNCLLKTLEEPPEYATIILTTSNESKLLTTVKSRCVHIHFENISQENIMKYLKENTSLDIDEKLVLMSEGSIGKAIMLQEEKELYQDILKLLNDMENNDLIYILNNAEVLYKQKDNIQEILNYINVCLYNSKEIKKINCIKYIEETKRRLLANSNYDMCIDFLLMKMKEEI